MEKKVLKIKIILLAVAAVILAVFIGIITFSNSPAQKLKKQLDLGQKYLNELSYDHAVAAFKRALEIEPNNTDAIAGITKTYGAWSSDLAASREYEAAIEKLDEARALLPDSQELVDKEVDAYLTWAATYEAAEDYENAISILNEAYDKLQDEKLQQKLEEIRELIKSKESITVKGVVYKRIPQEIIDIVHAKWGDNINVSWRTYGIRFDEPITVNAYEYDPNGYTDESFIGEVTISQAQYMLGEYMVGITNYLEENGLDEREIEVQINRNVIYLPEDKNDIKEDYGDYYLRNDLTPDGKSWYIIYPYGRYECQIIDVISQ